MEELKEKLIEIIGFGIERERAELKADEIIELFNANFTPKYPKYKTPQTFETEGN